MRGVHGVDMLLQKLTNLGLNADKCLDNVLMQAGLIVEGDAKDMCVTDTGRLKNSIHTKLGGSNENYSYKDNEGNEFSGSLSNLGQVHTAIVGTNVEYAAYVECGTGRRGEDSPSPPKYPNASYTEDWAGQEAQPFLWPALQQNQENIEKFISRELRREIRKVTGK